MASEPGLPWQAQAQQMVHAVQQLDALGLNRGSTGNASVRHSHGGQPGMLITPTGMGAADLQPQDLVWLGFEGPRFESQLIGPWQPSSEWQFHQAIYLQRPDLQAVLHTHSTYATALACLRRPLPAFHYMVAVAGGSDVPLVPYHLFGTESLSQAVAQTMKDRNACLLANHGLVAAGNSLAQAMKVLQEVESLCQSYLQALAVGQPVLLSDQDMVAVIERFKSYGKLARAG